ncbi:MAG: hypothetical protein HY260_23665 [Chloroflexi bacterium]|nr:hypothetical protein [Chloroflexota bacterium]
MPRKRKPTPAARPQVPEEWGVGVFQLRIWITPEDQSPYRPFVIMVIDLTNDLILNSDMAQTTPDANAVLAVLRNAMNHPVRGAGKPRRPERIVFVDPAHAESLAEPLAALAITCESRDLPMLDSIVRDMEIHMHRGRPEFPGLLSIEGVTPKMAGGLFAAAAEFYRAAPWVQLTNGQAFAVRFPANGGPEWIASIMGNGGVEYGLALYKSWEHFRRVFMGEGDNPYDTLSPEGHAAALFDNIASLPFEDLDALEQYGWEVAGEQAYPLALVIQAGDETVRRPTLTELRFLEAALRLVPRVMRDHMRPDGKGDFVPFQLTLPISAHAGDQMVFVRYPAGQLPLEGRAVKMDEWEAPDDEEDDEDEIPVFDRRLMEKMMAQIGAEVGAEPDIRDPKLREAQDLMYQAWEETNPAKRLALAHEALATSPDCADAYVLLAEEEADTLARAVGYYRKGMEAGERALGPEYFKESKGDFWGLLETRPYMRARAGLANCLWDLNRRDEAGEHYRALLELNRGDNQGVRYSLLTLLMQMGRDDEALDLLKRFKEDGMAEWLYTWALVEFRRSGPGKTADRRLKAALKQNPHVPDYLTLQKRVPNRLPQYIGLGDDAEAAHYASNHLNDWRRTPGAVEWLKGKL